MKKVCLVLVAILVSVASAQSPSQEQMVDWLEQSFNVWSRNPTTKAWEMGQARGMTCVQAYEFLDKAKTPASTKARLLVDTPELVKGDYTIGQLRPICDAMGAYERMKDFEGWVVMAMAESEKIGTSQYYDTAMFQRCIDSYNELIKSGIKPTMKILERDLTKADGSKLHLAGSLEALRTKWCDAPLKAVSAEMEAKFAPYKKALKADKLAMVVIEGANSARAYILPGGEVSTDPKKLAAANVWFSDTQSINDNRLVCAKKGNIQEIHTVKRYQFNAAHKLVKTTEKQYCGPVPAKAYK